MREMAYGFTAALTVAVVVVELLGAPVLVIFALTSLALVGLAWVLGQATESLGHHAGPRIGGVLNATFGNAAELITIFALSAGLTTVVKASIIGSISATSSSCSGRASSSAASKTEPRASRRPSPG